MSKIVFTLLMCLAFFAGYSAEDQHKHNEAKCGTVTPSYAWEQSFQQQLAAYKANQMQNGRLVDDSVTIPVIVHVCYYSATNPSPSNTSNNILGSQVASQFPILNANFAGNSAFAGNIPAVFRPLKADTKIKWCMATMDPNGNVLAEPGIDRVNTRTKGLPIPYPGGGATTNQWRRAYVEDTLKPGTIWDPRYYCNIWIIPSFIPDANGGLVLAYASFPTTTTLDGLGNGTGYSYNDGVVCGKRFFGTSGQATAPYNNGGTVCHELGHWLGLRHIWGDDSCGNDYCADTPTQQTSNSGSPTFPHVTCNNGPNGDMFMNYMDYVDDNVYNMFTLGQKDRMWTAMNTGQFRVPLKTSPTCNAIVPPPVADFIDSVKSQVLCTSKTIRFKDNSLFGVTTPASATYTWSFPGGTPSSGTGKFVDVTYTTGGLKSVTLTITNSRGTNTITKNVSVAISASAGTLPFSEDFEGVYFPPVGWETVNRNGNQNIMWEGVNGYSAYGTGNRCMKFDNTSLDAGYKKDDIMTSKIDLTGVTQAYLKFDVSHAPFYGQLTLNGPDEHLWDTLEVLITDNCQSTTQRIYRKGDSVLATVMPGQGDEFYPAANQWRTDSVAIPTAYLNKPNIQIIFRNYGDYGHSIYIDNINVKSPNTNPSATLTLTSATGTNAQTKCVGTALTNITYSVGSCGTGASITAGSLPAGVTGSYSSGVFTISGTPTATGTFNYTVTTSGSSCTPVSATGSITVNSNGTVSLTSATGTNAQTKCVGTAITNITYAVGGSSTGASVTGLPTGVSGTFASGVLTISGTPTATGIFNYTVTTSGSSCTNPTATGSITVNSNGTVSLSSATGTNAQTKCVGTAITNITYAVGGGATGASVTGLPLGVSGTFASGVLTISGTPTATGTFNYTVTTSGSSCTNPTATGSITVSPNATLSLSSATGTDAQNKCVGAAITNITYAVGGGATGASVTGLPAGVSGTFASGVLTISGTPTATGTFNYTVNTTGTCTQTSLTGSIVVSSCGCTSAPSATLSSTNGSVCGTTPITVSGNTFGGSATNVSLTENGAGSLNINTATVSPFSFTYTPSAGDAGNTVTITVTTNNPNGSPCVAASVSYTLTVTANGTVSLTSATGTNAQTKCVGTAITNITYAVGGSSTGASVTGLPTGVSGTFASGVLTISGTPTATGIFNYTVTTSGSSCTNPTATGSITVNPNATLSLTSATGTTNQSKCSGAAITNITYAVGGGATGASVTGLPAGVSGTFSSGVLTISGTPTATGTFNYTVNTTGTCTQTSMTGSITVNSLPTTPVITQNSGSDTIRTSSVGTSYAWYLNGSTTPVATTAEPYYIFTPTGTGPYTVTVTDASGCTSALSPSFTATPGTGVKNSSNSVKVFEIYPNPTEGRLVLNLNLYKSSEVSLSIYTPEGREVYAKSYGNTKAMTDELNINNLSKGVYIIKLNVNDEVHYHKVVKN